MLPVGQCTVFVKRGLRARVPSVGLWECARFLGGLKTAQESSCETVELDYHHICLLCFDRKMVLYYFYSKKSNPRPANRFRDRFARFSAETR